MIDSSCTCSQGRQPSRVPWLVLLLIAILFVVVAGGREIGAGTEPFLNNDEPRHIMTSVFCCDLLQIRPVQDPVGFAYAYYGHYPAIAPFHFPPLQHAITGAVFWLLGPSVALARSLILLMMVMLLLATWRLVRSAYGPEHAAICVLLLAVAPLLQSFRAVLMLEAPCLLWMTLSILCLHRYVRGGKRRHIWLSAAAATAAALTKQHAVVLIPALVTGCVVGFRRKHLLSPHTYLAPVMGVLITGGYYAASLRILKGSWVDVASLPRGNAVGVALECIWGFGAVTVALATVALVVGLATRRLGWLGWVSLAWLGGTIGLQMLIVRTGDIRYLVYCVVPIAVLAGRMAGEIAQSQSNAARIAVWGAVAAGVILPLYQSMQRPMPELRGYELAARKANELSQCSPVVFAGKLDGPFILYRRLNDPQLKTVTFRTSKLFGGGNILPNRWYVPFVSSPDEMRDRFLATGAGFVVFEDEPEIDSREHRWFWDWAHGAEFVEVCRIPVRYPSGLAGRLEIRRYTRTRTPVGSVCLRMNTLRIGRIAFDPNESLTGWNGRRN